jgi:hypothetical protein
LWTAPPLLFTLHGEEISYEAVYVEDLHRRLFVDPDLKDCVAMPYLVEK